MPEKYRADGIKLFVDWMSAMGNLRHAVRPFGTQRGTARTHMQHDEKSSSSTSFDTSPNHLRKSSTGTAMPWRLMYAPMAADGCGSEMGRTAENLDTLDNVDAKAETPACSLEYKNFTRVLDQMDGRIFAGEPQTMSAPPSFSTC